MVVYVVSLSLSLSVSCVCVSCVSCVCVCVRVVCGCVCVCVWCVVCGYTSMRGGCDRCPLHSDAYAYVQSPHRDIWFK